ncbi:hypothetical protein Q1695_009354 [Nippostrongylus brasiliensis]|nr:hypothetical protein Q1695_009354 [Nippostrongylus brasiliensis]
MRIVLSACYDYFGQLNYICFTILERLLDSAAKYKPISVQFTMNSLVLLLYVSLFCWYMYDDCFSLPFQSCNYIII